MKLTLDDEDGDPVSFKLSVPGRGEVAGATTFDDVNVEGTTRASRLTIRTQAREETSIGNLTVADSIGRITAKTTDLRGSLTVGGGLRRLVLDDVTGASQIAIGQFGRGSGALMVVLGDVADLTVTSEMPLRSIVVNSWDDTDATEDGISAPRIDRVVVRTGSLEARVTSETSVGRVEARRGSITGDIVARGGSIGRVLAGSRSQVGNIEGALLASRDVTTVRAFGDLTGDIAAGRDVVRVMARSILGTADDRLTVTAGRDVRTVLAKRDLAHGTVTAGRNVLIVKAQNDIVGTRVESGMNAGGGYIGKVQAVHGDIVDPHLVAGRGAGPDGVYGGDGIADDATLSGDVRGVHALRGLITSSDGTEDFIVAAEAVMTVKDRRGRHDVSWGQTRIVEG